MNTETLQPPANFPTASKCTRILIAVLAASRDQETPEAMQCPAPSEDEPQPNLPET